MILAFILVGVYSWMFFYPQLQDYLEFQQDLSSVNKQIEESETKLGSLREERNLHKSAYDEEFKEEVKELIDGILQLAILR